MQRGAKKGTCIIKTRVAALSWDKIQTKRARAKNAGGSLKERRLTNLRDKELGARARNWSDWRKLDVCKDTRGGLCPPVCKMGRRLSVCAEGVWVWGGWGGAVEWMQRSANLPYACCSLRRQTPFLQGPFVCWGESVSHSLQDLKNGEGGCSRSLGVPSFQWPWRRKNSGPSFTTGITQHRGSVPKLRGERGCHHDPPPSLKSPSNEAAVSTDERWSLGPNAAVKELIRLQQMSAQTHSKGPPKISKRCLW